MWSLQNGLLPTNEALRNDLEALYDSDIAWSDTYFGKFIERLSSLGLYDSTLVVLLSDHGEEFYEHEGWMHSRTLYIEQLWVPLVIKFPGDWQAGRRIAPPVQHVDLLPTILDYVGFEAPTRSEGRSLLPLVIGSPDGWQMRPAISQLELRGRFIESVVADETHLIQYVVDRHRRSHPPVEMFSLTEDPAEQMNRAYESTVESGYLRSLLRTAKASPDADLATEPGPLPARVRDRLRALGYVE
jgi:arylsulfatase A-like enzyme